MENKQQTMQLINLIYLVVILPGGQVNAWNGAAVDQLVPFTVGNQERELLNEIDFQIVA